MQSLPQRITLRLPGDVAAALRRDGLGTLLIDLLTEGEERVDARTGHLRFDIGLLARRVTAAAGWVRSEVPIPLGCFGASTAAAAALVAAADRPRDIDAVVSRGGRPDLAGDSLERVEAPTLLIVGSRDLEVLDLNRRALARLRGRKDLRIVEGATHLFEEPGALERVAALARDWFLRHLAT